MTSYQEICAWLVARGVGLGYSVIPETRLALEHPHRRCIDIVWALRLTHAQAVAPFHDVWHIAATFEVEGCNVPWPEFTRHLTALAHDENPGGPAPARYIVLYTTNDARVGWGQETETRIICLGERVASVWGFEEQISVIDGPQVALRLDNFPTAQQLTAQLAVAR